METVNYNHTIWKGSNAQISFPVLPPYSTATTEDMVANFYTTSSGTSIEFTQSGGTLSISGTVGTVVFQPVQLEALEDGLLKYILEYTIEGSATTVQLETRWYLKTPNPYTAISFTSKEYVDNALSGKQATLVSGTNIKTINNQSLLGSGNIEISGGSGSDYYAGTNIDITNHIISVTGLTIPTKTSQLTNDSGFLTEHQSLAGYATESWVEGKGYLTSHQDISMKADTTAVTEAISTATADMATQTWVGQQGYLTEHQSLSGKQDTLVSGTNIKTINNQSLLGSGNIEISGGSGSDYYAGSNIDITNHVISVTGITVPTKTSELTNDSGFLTQHQSLSGYATEQWVEAKGYLTSHQDISMKADTTAVTQSLGNKQDTLVSGTNIKTINSQSILGSGNIEISGGSSYTAGTGIEISNNTIAVDETYVATKASVAQLEQIKEDNSNKVTAITSGSTDTQYPSAKAVYNAVSGAGKTYSAGLGIVISSDTISIDEDVVAKIDDVSEELQQKQSIDYMVTAVTSSSTNEEYPSAKAVYDALTAKTYSAGTNIDITNNVISVTGITVPTKTSELTNDSGFLTSHQSLAEYYTSAQTQSAISTAVANKVSSSTATDIWTGTQAEYDAIATKSATTIYLIK